MNRYVFKDVDSWSNKKIKTNYIIYTIIYYLFTLLAPTIVVCINYGLFKNAVQSKKLNGALLLLIMIFVIVVFRAFKKVVNRLPEETMKQQKVKYSLLCLYSLAIPLSIAILLIFSHKQLELAYNTALWCIGFFSLGIIVDHCFIMYLDNTMKVDAEADHTERIAKRRHVKASQQK